MTIDGIADNFITHIMMLGPDPTADIEYLKRIKRNDMHGFHHGLGMQIRNEYGLWDKTNPLTKVWHDLRDVGSNEGIIDGVDHHPNHPDAVSMEILYRIWDKVQDL
jgi:hypothetical protein